MALPSICDGARPHRSTYHIVCVRMCVCAPSFQGQKVTEADGFNPSTTSLLNRYLEVRRRVGCLALCDI